MIENYYYNHDYCINQTTMIAIAAVVCFIKNQQPSSALIILNVIDALTKHFFTLSDIVIRIKKSTISDWYPSRKSKFSTKFYNSICTSSSNVDLIKLGFSATEPV